MSFREIPDSFRTVLEEFLTQDLNGVVGNRQWGYFPKAFFDYGSRYRAARNELPQTNRGPSGVFDTDDGAKEFFAEKRYHQLETEEAKHCFLLGYVERQFYRDGIKRNHHVKRFTAIWEFIKHRSAWGGYHCNTGDRIIHNADGVELRFVESAAEFVALAHSEFEYSDTVLPFYRGIDNAHFSHTPKIFRNREWCNHEAAMLRDLMLAHPGEFSRDAPVIEWLARAQHYCLPTRLLDISTNPLVSLWFACGADTANEDTGIVDTFLVPKQQEPPAIAYPDDLSVSALANLSRMSATFNNESDEELQAAFRRLVLREHPLATQQELDQIDLGTPLVVRTGQDNERLRVQAGAFVLFGNESQNQPSSIPNSWFPTENRRRTVTLIRAKDKPEIRRSLRKLNIHAATVFPGLESTAKQISTQYYR